MSIRVRGGFPEARLAEHTVITGDPEAENSFAAPLAVSPRPGAAGAVTCAGGRLCTVALEPFSANFLRFEVPGA